jgi:sugar phosphate isomerase/epimerase
MQIGLLTGPFKDVEFEEMAAWASDQGFDALEVACGPGNRHVDLSRLTPAKIKTWARIREEYFIDYSSFAYYANVAEADSRKRAAVLAGVEKTIDLAAKLKVRVVCTLAGSAAPGKSKSETIRELAAPSLRRLAKYARKKGVCLALENYFATNLQHLDLWRELFELVPDDNLGLNFDPSHLVWQGIDYLAAVEEFGSRIFHTHAKDTEIREDRLRRVGCIGSGWWRYVIPGYGRVAWGEYVGALRRVGYDGVLSIEHEDSAFGVKEGFVAGLQYLWRFAAREVPAYEPEQKD